MLSADPGGQLRPGIDLVRKQIGIARLEQNVVEGDALVGDAVVHREKLHSDPEMMPARRDARSDWR